MMRCDPKSSGGSIFDKTWYIRRGAVHESKKVSQGFVVDVRNPSLVLEKFPAGFNVRADFFSNSTANYTKLKKQESKEVAKTSSQIDFQHS